MVGFNDNYLDRTAGLRNFAYPQPTAPAQSVEEKSPLGKFLDFATEAFSPGHVAQNEIAAQPAAAPEPAFRNTGLGEFIGNIIPGLNQVYAGQDRTALSQYAQNMPADPAQAIKGMMTADPHNTDKYADQLLQLTAQQGDPLHKLQIQNAELALKSATTEQDRQTALGNYLKALSQPTAPEGGVLAPSSPSGSPPIGAGNNNFLNIRDNPANAWEGQTGANKGFATFTTPEHGFRAAAKTLNSYAQEGINTLDGVIQRWAPAADNNDPEKYAEFVSHETGIPRNVSINVADPAIQRKLLGAMQKQEVGRDKAAPQSVVDAGVQLAQQIPNGAMTPVPGFKDAKDIETPILLAPAAPTSAASPAPQPKSALSKYQEMALQMAALDPKGFGDNALAAFAPKVEAAGENTSEIKNYEFAKTHPDFATSKTLSGQMSSFHDTSPFAVARDSGVTGDQLIATVPDKNVQNIAKQLLRGDAPFFTVSQKTPAAQRAAMELAQAADPSYSATTAPVRMQQAKYFSSAGEGGKLLSSVKAIAGHVVTMNKLHEEMGNTFLQPYNYLSNKISMAADTDAGASVNSYNEAVNNIAPEVAKVVIGKTDVPLAEIEHQREPFSSSLGDKGFEKATQTAADMVATRAKIMLDNWREAMGNDSKPPAGQLDAKTIRTFKKLGVDLNEYFDTSKKSAGVVPGEDSPPSLDMATLQAAAAAELAKRKGD